MDYKIIHVTLQGKCVCCGKRAPDCPSWEQCYERRLMDGGGGYGGFFVCVLCGGGFAGREKLQHAGACLATYLRRVDELRDSQVADRLAPYAGGANAGAGHAREAGSGAKVRPSQLAGEHDGPAVWGDLPASLAWMCPGSGIKKPTAQKTMTFATRRPRPAKIVVKDKGVQAEARLREKSTQTSPIQLRPGEDVHFIRWTGVVQTKRPLLESDREKIYSLLENLRRAVTDVLGEGGLDTEDEASHEEAFAGASRQLDEFERILDARRIALERAMGLGSFGSSDDEEIEGSPRKTSTPRDESGEAEAAGESETEIEVSFASAQTDGGLEDAELSDVTDTASEVAEDDN